MTMDRVYNPHQQHSFQQQQVTTQSQLHRHVQNQHQTNALHERLSPIDDEPEQPRNNRHNHHIIVPQNNLDLPYHRPQHSLQIHPPVPHPPPQCIPRRPSPVNQQNTTPQPHQPQDRLPGLHRPAHPPPPPPTAGLRYSPVDTCNNVPPSLPMNTRVQVSNRLEHNTTQTKSSLPPNHHYANAQFQNHQVYNPSMHPRHPRDVIVDQIERPLNTNMPPPNGVHKSVVAEPAVVDSGDGYSGGHEEEVIQAILAAKEALEKMAEERDRRDIELIDNLCSLVHGFDSFPRSVRRALAAKSLLIVIDEKEKELIVHNEELDSFCVVIFGECEQMDVTKTFSIRHYRVGDSFGVCEPTTDTVRFVGHMVTRCENCAFLCVKRDDFYSILTDPANYPHKEVIRHRDKSGNVVCVSQFHIERKSSGPSWSHHLQSNNPFKINLPDGHIISKATESCLLTALVDGYDRIDPEYVEDFLLLFRVFMTHDQRDKDKKLPPGMIQLCLTLTKWLDNISYRDRVVKIILTWLSSYYHDFELNPEFSHLYFKVLESRLLSLSMSNQLHLLHVTLSTKSKIRHVTLSRSSREQPLGFSISGGYEKNCGIFVTQLHGSRNDENSNENLKNYLRYNVPSIENLRLGPSVPPRQNSQNAEMKSIPLRPGDQILEVNGTNFSAIKLVEAQKKLDMSTHLSLTVRYNPSLFHEMKALPEGRRKSSMSSLSSVSPFLPANSSNKFTFSQSDQLGQRLNNDPYPPASPLFSANANFGFRSMIKSLPKNDKSRLTSLINSSKQLVKQIRDSTAQVTTNNIETMSKTSDNISDDQSNEGDMSKAKSNPDLLGGKPKDRPIETNLSSIVRLDDIAVATPTENASTNDQALINVLKVFNAANNECRYLLIHEETTAREVVMVAVKEFNLTGSSGPISPPGEKTVSSLNWHLYEVSVVPESRTIKQKCLSEQTSHLAERASLCSRFYIKNNAQSSFGQSRLDMDDDALVNEILKESPPTINLTSLDPILLAVELTLVDFDKFRKIEPQQFVYDTFFDYSEKHSSSNGSSSFDKASLKSSSSDGQDSDPVQALNKSRIIPKSWMQEYQEFADISNKEMFWVVCEILNGQSINERVKIIKQFIRVAYVCERLRNYNSMFAIISGLGHSCVHRLKRTFDKLKTDYKRELDTMRNLFDPSRNMLNYRSCLQQTPPPAIPLFPQIKKDLTFTKEGRSIFVRESNDLSDDEFHDVAQDTIKRKTRDGLLSVKSATVGNHDEKFSNDFQTTRSFTFTPFYNRTNISDSDSVLVNFAEIRQFTDRVRNVIHFSSVPYTKDLLTYSQKNQAQIKKMHEEWQMRKRIRHYISQTLNNPVQPEDTKIAPDQVDSGVPRQNGRHKGKLNFTYDERTLYQRSLEVEPEVNTRPTNNSQPASERLVAPPNLQTATNPTSLQQQTPAAALGPMHPPSVSNSSPTLSKSSSLSSCSSFSHHLPNYQGPRANLSSSVGKFGTESTESLRKLQALSENVSDWQSYNNGNTNSNLSDRAKGLMASKLLPPKTGR